MLLLFTSLIDDETDKQRFEDIYYCYHKQMLVIAKGILHNQQDAEDAVQNALLNIARHMDRVPKGNQKILTAYIYTTARNTAISLLRKKSREVETVNMDALPLAVIDDPIERIMQQDDYDILLSVISKLPLAHRELIFLRYVQGKEVKEIAELLHRTPNYIRVQTFRARQQLLELCREVGMEIE